MEDGFMKGVKSVERTIIDNLFKSYPNKHHTTFWVKYRETKDWKACLPLLKIANDEAQWLPEIHNLTSIPEPIC